MLNGFWRRFMKLCITNSFYTTAVYRHYVYWALYAHEENSLYETLFKMIYSWSIYDRYFTCFAKKMGQGIIILLIETLFYCKRDFLLSGIIFSKIIGKKQSSEASIVNLQRNKLHVFRKQCLYTGRWRRTISSGLLLGDDSLKWEAPFWSYQDIGRSN